ncbi:hypothetical protein M406DRAFT_38109 [Cryphonectria parasitica EP155]|uniref:Polyketide synthase n=1 Tax=Cryphonectria parasitica (strain ATCC 38755 / EP155) TaxID=660469 RepID=A0A9P5CR04_CRYP1|nr:uncharacterized protein M406DRAFT_38109 [Cryphonectria parasitica EP155]KAF3766625.1 hypothetical protein M406DRAFT_38109 [Cryphonectria parasitica EP155]
MERNATPAGSEGTLYVFGPQALSLHRGYFSRVRSHVKTDPEARWVLDAVQDCLDSWDALEDAIPDLRQIQGRAQLETLLGWLQNEIPDLAGPSTPHLSNTILGPLVIISHLWEYEQFQQGRLDGPRGENEVALGFCLGILSSVVVTYSLSRPEFQRNGAAALRLAMAVGAIVDAQNVGPGTSSSLAAAWNSIGRGDLEMAKILVEFPDAYLAVSYDRNRATLTASRASIMSLRGRLDTARITTSELGLHGRFHNPVHQENLKSLLRFCSQQQGFRFPNASSPAMPLQMTSTDRTTVHAFSMSAAPHEEALRAILLDHSNWIGTFSRALETTRRSSSSTTVRVVSFGPERCVPPSIFQEHHTHVTHFGELDGQHEDAEIRDDDIAVTGMACNVAGAEDLESFWEILLAGKSQHRKVATDRFVFNTVFRPDHDPGRDWFGNFIEDAQAFDHHFFGISPREAVSMDPQQRLLLQNAYQTVSQSGYLQDPPHQRDQSVGCYIGVCATDYEGNVAHHAPTSFSATGNLRSFISGKVSHYFGWTGPGLTIDTACSSSAVAIHQACRAILNDECRAALAGGTNFISSPLWYQNLAAASFLSPSGQCRPFDARADGYCRGEAIATVFLKRLSRAVADGDPILGVISATAVIQNDNSTPIFVPNRSSLSALFRDVSLKSQTPASQISYVEAHGTGTPVGDPIEFDSIQSFLGSGSRGLDSPPGPAQLGSVKGLVGHTEGSSGVVSLIKVLLMMHHGLIVPQASFDSTNPSIKISPGVLEISRQAALWRTGPQIALINNYGASGSNASMIVKQVPGLWRRDRHRLRHVPVHRDEVPFCISGRHDGSVRAYAKRLCRFILRSRDINAKDMSLADFSFNLARQSDWSLQTAAIFTSSTLEELGQTLAGIEEGRILPVRLPEPQPVIFCFGGQISTFVGLDRAVYESCKILRVHLDRCDRVCQNLGATSIFPGIFQLEPISDPSELQPILFSMQYACAMAWIESGLQPAALVGQSFGELGALCVSGSLSLYDALRMVLGRSRIIRDSWGPEKGAMIAIQGELQDVEALLAAVGGGASIACFNGPRSFTVASTTRIADALESVLRSRKDGLAVIRYKRLNVTHAFHSGLVDPLKDKLQELGRGLSFAEPTIPLQRATELPCNELPMAGYVWEHMRQPVHFSHAVQRLQQRYPSAVWVEAGSNSSITNMAGRALSDLKSHVLLPVNITSGHPLQQLTEATMSLWEAGIRAKHWAHHKSQSREYNFICLPPYQFDKQHHWLTFKEPPRDSPRPEGDTQIEETQDLHTFLAYRDSNEKCARFRVNTKTQRYRDIVSGHIIARTAPICPATLEVEIAVQAILSIRGVSSQTRSRPQIRDVHNLAPVCDGPGRTVYLEAQPISTAPDAWAFKIFSSEPDTANKTVLTYVTGEVQFLETEDPKLRAGLGRLERLVSHQRCLELLQRQNADNILQGQAIYRLFSDVVDYGPAFRGLQKLVGHGHEVAGRVVRQQSSEPWALDPFQADCFSQVGGIWINCFANDNPDDMFIACGFEEWTKNPVAALDPEPKHSDGHKAWNIFAVNSPDQAGRNFLTDIFVFEERSGLLAEVILGIRYSRVTKASMSRLLTRLSSGPPPPATGGELTLPKAEYLGKEPESRKGPPIAPMDVSLGPGCATRQENGGTSLSWKLKTVLADLSGIDASEIKDAVQLADMGIDSLMSIELGRDIQSSFGCSLPAHELMHIADFPGLLACLEKAMGIYQQPVADAQNLETTSSSSRRSPTQDESTESSVSSGVSVASASMHTPATHTILQIFKDCRILTEKAVQKHRCLGYVKDVLPRQDNLCAVLTVEAFRTLGCNLVTAEPGEELVRIPHAPQHGRLSDYLYRLLEDAELVKIVDGHITRTDTAVPSSGSREMLQDLMRDCPDHHFANQLAYWTGSRLADVVRGKVDGLQLIFGSERGRQLVAGLYGDSFLNRLSYSLMSDFLSRLLRQVYGLHRSGGPINILELGGGTGGTTKASNLTMGLIIWLLPMLAQLGLPIRYTFTDISPSLVSAARKALKGYPFVKFCVQDIEKPPSHPELLGSQHIIIATNVIHATHSLVGSARNIRRLLRADGFLLMLEMTNRLHWVDMIFGVLEGWWLFDDGREHAIVDQDSWKRALQDGGFAHVDWTDGATPEASIQRIFLATASSPAREAPPHLSSSEQEPVRGPGRRRSCSREDEVNGYVSAFSEGFSIPIPSATRFDKTEAPSSRTRSVLVTGATGSLGCHLVAYLANLDEVQTVYCLNRRGGGDPLARQTASLQSKQLALDATAQSKVKVFEGDAAQPLLGLPPDVHDELVDNVTHIIHNAWPMSGRRPVQGFEPQFRAMRHLVDLASSIVVRRNITLQHKITFQFISSIATVAYHPLVSGCADVPEERMDYASVLANGYGEAKFICERILDETLHRYPERFRPMVVRLGQVAGSNVTGYWNSLEHFPFIVRSAQTLGTFPDLQGPVSWTPVNEVAAVCTDLLLNHEEPCYPVYHIDRRLQMGWREMIPIFVKTLLMQKEDIIPFGDWLRRVRNFQGQERDNPAVRLMDFLEQDFERMSCGGVLLGTRHTHEHSETFRQAKSLDSNAVVRYIRAWRDTGFLN